MASAKAICSVIGGEVVPQFPHTANQWRVRIAFRRQRRESGEKSIAAIRPYPLTSRQPSNRTYHFDID